MREPLLCSVVTEFTETAVNEELLMTDDVAEMAKTAHEVVMTRAPATVIGDGHSIQVQVVDVDITLSERSMDQRQAVEMREKGVLEECTASLEGVERVSASMGVEKVIQQEDNTMSRHAVAPHRRETQPDTFEQMVSKEAEEADGNVEIPDKELAHKKGKSAEASHREADPHRLEFSINQESLEATKDDLRKSEGTEDLTQTISTSTVPQNIYVESMSEAAWEKDGNWALEAEEPMAPTEGVQAPVVVEEEPSSQTGCHKETDPVWEGPQEALAKIEAVDSQKEKDLTEEGVQSQAPLSQTAQDESQNTEPTKESPQIPKAEEPLSQTGPLSQLDPLGDLKTTEQSEVSVQGLETEKPVSQLDKDDNLTKVSVLNPETKEQLHEMLIKGFQMLASEELSSELPSVVIHKETVATEVVILELDSGDSVKHKQTRITRQSVPAQETEKSLCPKEPVENQTQTSQTKDSQQAPKAEESISQKESTGSQKQAALPEEHDLTLPESTETQEWTEPLEEHFQPKEESKQTQKQTDLPQKHVQGRAYQEPLPQKESSKSPQNVQLSEDQDQTCENQESLPQKDSTETQKQCESSVLAPEMENTSFPTEPAEDQKQTVHVKETSEPSRELESMAIAVVTQPPVLLDSGLEVMETEAAAEEILPGLAGEEIQPVETAEEVGSKENEISKISTTDTLKTAQKTETEALVKEADEEQDIWVDAKEDLDFQEATDRLPSQDDNSRHDCSQETETANEEESEMVPNPEAGSDSECENFAAALDDP
ncbi:uncharacterized protein LOC133513382 [Syngnathoides biaculeatus]|uniref:uncharacterized protein LOC133513382 n=1 Tax=Syngnathoides biaculeatus TaxID=300417 RepID=UPI002ADDB174|nr:uncharacterized protein LOC133513382 [Syngnathoides biaculeatus]